MTRSLMYAWAATLIDVTFAVTSSETRDADAGEIADTVYARAAIVARVWKWKWN